MFLSMVIPVYNTEKYLEACLDSCLEQDIPKSEYEILCINDGSSDGSLEILRRYQARCTNLHVIDQPNGGVSSARNAGLDAAQGDYVWFIDSDDLIEPNCLHALQDTLRSCSVPCDLLTFRSYFFQEHFTSREETLKRSGQLISNQTFSSITMHLFRRSVLKDLRFPLGIAYGEDVIFIRKFFLLEPSQESIDRILYYYRTNPSSAMHTYSDLRLSSYVLGAVELYRIYCVPNGKCEANANILIHTLNSALLCIARSKTSASRAALKRLREEKLFPFKRPPECTAWNAFVTSRTDFIGKLFNWLCLHAHTRIGFFLLRLWYAAFRLLKKQPH